MIESNPHWGRYQRPKGEDPRDTLVRRSMLIVPANVARFVTKAATTDADVVMLDLEDGVSASEKTHARDVLSDAVRTVSASGASVVVRVNHPFELCVLDLEAAVAAGTDGVAFPKVASPDELAFVDGFLTYLERRHGRDVGSVSISSSIETAAAFFRLQEIAAATDRLVTIAFSTEDIAVELGVRPTDEGLERLLGNAMVVLAAAARRIIPIGMLGYVSDYKNLDAFERSVKRSAAFGFQGGGAIHPTQVPILNRWFGPQDEEIRLAREIMAALDPESSAGTASVRGRMVDIATVKWARRILARDEQIKSREDRRFDEVNRRGA